MRIIRVEVYGLLGKPGVVAADFSADLNIITGKNGVGKTTFLKIIWYIISGNILLALNEISFAKCFIKTDVYECTVFKLSASTCKVELIIGGEEFEFEDNIDDDDFSMTNAEDAANEILRKTGGSVFFPTFRRIEGGFTLNPRSSGAGGVRNALLQTGRSRNEVEDGLVSLAQRLTNFSHIFVSSISTVDIVNLLLARFADLSSLYNDIQQKTSESIIARIKEYRSDPVVENSSTANDIIDNIRLSIESMEDNRELIMTPMNAVRDLVVRLFNHSGISFGSRLNFGDAANAVNSNSLSAGEKQLLSFISYNAFNQDCVLLIDEPELSLHVDWQRQLFPILLKQQSSNQFIIATHSPFIYSRYPDREILIDADRGDEGEAE